MTAAAGPWQDALLAGVPMAARELPRARSVLAGLARFAAGQGIAASPEWLLDFDMVEAFCVRGCAGRAPATCGTYRSVLYQLAAPVHGVPGRRGTPFAGAGAPAPYQLAERAELAAVAAAQRDPARRAPALAMVVFGIGGGLRPGAGRAARHRRRPGRRPGHRARHWRPGAPHSARAPALRGPGAGAGPCGGRAVRVLSRPGGPRL